MFRTHAATATERHFSTGNRNGWSVDVFASPYRLQSIRTISEFNKNNEGRAAFVRGTDRKDILISEFDSQKIAENKKSLIVVGYYQ